MSASNLDGVSRPGGTDCGIGFGFNGWVGREVLGANDGMNSFAVALISPRGFSSYEIGNVLSTGCCIGTGAGAGARTGDFDLLLGEWEFFCDFPFRFFPFRFWDLFDFGDFDADLELLLSTTGASDGIPGGTPTLELSNGFIFDVL